MRKLLKVFEHETLKVGTDGLTEAHLKLLTKFRGDKEDETFNYYTLVNNGIKFKSFVGVLCVGDIQIEVLPKADKYIINNSQTDEKTVWQGYLLSMLKVVFKLKIDLPTIAEQQMTRSKILDVFIERFLDEVEMLMHIGLVRSYRRVEGNRNSLSGKLLTSKNVTQNIIHKERFYVSYTTYDHNHICNCILYKVLEILPNITTNTHIRNRVTTMTFDFPELNEIEITESTFSKIAYNRKTDNYKIAIDLAKLILLNYMPNLTHNRHDKILALMFDMNKLWEEYVYIMLRRKYPDYKVVAQSHKIFWRSHLGNKIIKPDILIEKNDDGKSIILDTKWKCLDNKLPSDNDLHQIFVYHKYYKDAKVALLYPGQSPCIMGEFDLNNAKSAMFFLPIENCITEELQKFIKS